MGSRVSQIKKQYSGDKKSPEKKQQHGSSQEGTPKSQQEESQQAQPERQHSVTETRDVPKAQAPINEAVKEQQVVEVKQAEAEPLQTSANPQEQVVEPSVKDEQPLAEDANKVSDEPRGASEDSEPEKEPLEPPQEAVVSSVEASHQNTENPVASAQECPPSNPPEQTNESTEPPIEQQGSGEAVEPDVKQEMLITLDSSQTSCQAAADEGHHELDQAVDNSKSASEDSRPEQQLSESQQGEAAAPSTETQHTAIESPESSTQESSPNIPVEQTNGLLEQSAEPKEPEDNHQQAVESDVEQDRLLTLHSSQTACQAAVGSHHELDQGDDNSKPISEELRPEQEPSELQQGEAAAPSTETQHTAIESPEAGAQEPSAKDPPKQSNGLVEKPIELRSSEESQQQSTVDSQRPAESVKEHENLIEIEANKPDQN